MARPPAAHQITTFLVATFALSAFYYWFFLRDLQTTKSLLLVGLYWIPGVVALYCSRHFGNQRRDLALIPPGRISVAVAYLIPTIAVAAAIGTLIFAHLGQYQWPERGALRALAFHPTVGVLVAAMWSFGQELGWRGFLQNQILRAQVPEPLLVIGLIWCFWHWPLLLNPDFVGIPNMWLGLALFFVQTMAFSVILSWLREFSKSIYPSALAHATHASLIQGTLPAFFVPGRSHPLFSGSFAIPITVIYFLAAIFVYRKFAVRKSYSAQSQIGIKPNTLTGSHKRRSS